MLAKVERRLSGARKVDKARARAVGGLRGLDRAKVDEARAKAVGVGGPRDLDRAKGDDERQQALPE
jgi:hypothetical protein